MNPKFARLEDATAEHRYGNVFAHEVYPKWSRVAIGADEGQIHLMLEIAKTWQGPYGVLYVLVVPRCEHKAARYQSAEPCTYEQLEQFACTFQEYFENDGRHHLWFIDVPSGAQLVYDNHDIIYSYRNDQAVIDLLKARGLKEGEVRIPAPHGHAYNSEHDVHEDEIMSYWQWLEFPLQEEHDDP